MSSFSDDLETKVLNATLGRTAWSPVGAVYVALFTTPGPTDTNDTTKECSTTATGWTAYARQPVGVGTVALAAAWSNPSAGAGGVMETKNQATISFPANDGVADVVVTHMGLYDASTGGNLLYHNALVASKTLLTNDTLAFGPNSITVSLA